MSNTPDPLSVQVSLRVRVPKGTQITKKALNEIYLNWVETGNLPPNIEIRGVFWKNPARRAPLDDWRYSSYSDLSTIIKPLKFRVDGELVELTYGQMNSRQREIARRKYNIEDTPRGDHEEARDTLQGALRLFRPF
jgi:hypothetical protein